MPAYETEVEWGRLPAAAIRRRVARRVHIPLR